MNGLLNKFKKGLQRTKTMLVRNIQAVFTDNGAWTQDQYDDLEAALIGADLGVGVATRLVDSVRDQYERGLIQTSSDLLACARQEIVSVFAREHPPLSLDAQPTVILMVGVNGSGKTTTTGKLAHRWQAEGKSVLLAACDTFRAAAVEQIKIWGERVDCQVVSAKHGADAAAVAYDACSAAVSRGHDIVLIDTAGRQHTRKGLMEELAKIRRTIDKACPGAPHEVWLVVDGSTGTNALQQAREFSRVVDITGLCLTKLDGSSKGGVVVAIYDELGFPVRFVGLGEGTEDIEAFDPGVFADALLEIE